MRRSATAALPLGCAVALAIGPSRLAWLARSDSGTRLRLRRALRPGREPQAGAWSFGGLAVPGRLGPGRAIRDGPGG